MRTTLFFLLLVAYTTLAAQSPFNKIYSAIDTTTRVEKLYETEDAYYVLGYADYILTAYYGFQMVKHDRSSGEVLSKSYFGIEDEFMAITGQSPIYRRGDKLVFHCDSPHMYEFEYDLVSHQISKVDSFENLEPDVSGFFLKDVQMFGDTTIYSVFYPYDNGDFYKPGLLIKYPDGSKKVKLYEISDSISGIGQIRKLSGDRYLLTSRHVGPMPFWDYKIGINILDENFNIIKHFSTPTIDHYVRIDDMYMPDDTTAFLMVRKHVWDNIGGAVGFEHVLLRYNLNTEEIEWRFGNSEFPIEQGTSRGSLVPSHEKDHLLYCTTEGRYHETGDSLEIVGKVYKVNYDGELVWERSYSHHNKYGSRNTFRVMIPTSDWRYLIGGMASYGFVNSWLVKIDEDGNVIADNVSGINELADDTELNWDLYPNPADDYVEIRFDQPLGAKSTLSIYNFKGSLLSTTVLARGSSHHFIKVDELPSGAYPYQIVSDNGILGTGTFVKD